MILNTLLILSLVPWLTVNGTHFTVTSQVYLDFSHDGQHIGRTTIGLFGDLAPRTVANFREICINGIDGQTYVGSPIHRIIDKFMIQGIYLIEIWVKLLRLKNDDAVSGGDIVSGDGHGSISIYGKYFDDEYLEINHTGPGFLAMANKGSDTNGCQFYITTLSAPWLDGKHTIFGKVVNGQGFVHTVEKVSNPKSIHYCNCNCRACEKD